MPAFKAAYLEDAIKSISSQSSPDWELVVVDDCSPENLSEIVRQFDDPRISYVRNEVNLGGSNLVRQWNHCITFARGDWVVMAADDDLYAPGFCAEVLRLAAQYPDVDLIRARVEQIGPGGEHLGDDSHFPEFSSCYRYINDWMNGKAFTCVGNFAFRRSRLTAIGGFKEFPCAFCSDIATPLMLAEHGVANTAEMLFKFRHSSLHLSGDRSRLQDKMEASMQFYEWLSGFEYPAPFSSEDAGLYESVMNPAYIHQKCIYDCFNQAIAFSTLRELPSYLHQCRAASFPEKCIMAARWVKRIIFGLKRA